QISDDDEVEELQIGDDDEVEELQIGDDDEVEDLLKDNQNLTYDEIDISTTTEIKIVEDNQKPTSQTNISKKTSAESENQNSKKE
nr:hypothetical protein [Deltaproteobacteria bacterium]